MAANQLQTTNDVSSQSLMKIQSTNFSVQSDESVYLEELQILIVALKSSVLSTAMFNSFVVPISWLSLAGSTTTYKKNHDDCNIPIDQ